MHFFARATITGLVLFVTPGCASVPTRRQPFPTPEAYALVDRSEARFVFPIDSTQSYHWDVPARGAVAGAPLFIWDVTWETAETTAASDSPYGLVLVVRWKAGGEKSGSLSQLISTDPLQTKSSCHCAGPVYIARPDPDLFASVDDGRLVFNVRGSDAVRRIFPVVPDSVEFRYRVGEVEILRAVPVARSNQ